MYSSLVPSGPVHSAFGARSHMIGARAGRRKMFVSLHDKGLECAARNAYALAREQFEQRWASVTFKCAAAQVHSLPKCVALSCAHEQQKPLVRDVRHPLESPQAQNTDVRSRRGICTSPLLTDHLLP